MTKSYKSAAILLLFACLLLPSFSNAQSWQWLTSGGSTAGLEIGRAACTDAAGNAYFCGNFNNSVTIGGFPLTTAGGNDIFVAKFNAAGVCQWAVRGGGSGAGLDAANGITTDGTTVFITGTIAPSSATFGSFTLITNTTTSEGFFAALNASTGAFTWATNFSNTPGGGDVGHALCMDGSGGLYAIGNFNGTINFGSASYTSSGIGEVFIAKVNPANGAFVWGAVGGSPGTDNGIGSSLCYVPGLNEIVAGASSGPGAGSFYTTSPASGPFTFNNTGLVGDIVLLELNASTGAILSLLHHPGANQDDCLGVCYDPSTTNVMLTGYFQSPSITFGSTTLTNAGAATTEDIFIASYNPTTNTFPWAVRAGGTLNERAWGVSSAGNGVIAVTGQFRSSPTAFGSTNLNSFNTFADVFVTALIPSSGAYVWAIAASGNDAGLDDVGRAVAYTTNGSGNVYVTGQFGGTLTAGSFSATSAGSVDPFFAKLLAPPPLVATQSQVNLTCNGGFTGSATVVASGGVSPYTYSWSPSGGSNATATGLSAQNYTCTITDNVGTQITKTFLITQPPPLATPTPSSNSPVCTGNTINLFTPTVAGATYSWTGPLAFASSTQNPTRASATVAMAGTYSVTYTSGGCTSPVGTTAVVVNTTPGTPSASSNTPVCTGNTINLSTPAVAGATYSWTGPNSFVSSVQNPIITNATVAMAGTYSVTVTTNGCTSGVGTTAVVINTTPATPTASSNTPVCSGNTISLSTPAVAGATYSWTGPSSFVSALQNPTRPAATVAMAGTYSVTVTANGCTSGVGTTAVVVNATPATPTASSNSPVCSGNSINLSTPAVAGATYSWTGPNSFVSSVQNPIITNATVAMAGTYSVTVTTNGCTSGVGTTAVVVNPSPATPTASSNTPVCSGNTINLSTPAVAGATYSWTGPNSFVSSLQNPIITNATVAMAGTYSVTVTASGCTSAAGTTAVVVNATPATPTASSNSPVCTGNTINLSTPAVAGATYSWTGPNSFVSSVQNPIITNATVAMAGTYSVTVTTNGCTSGVGTTAVVVNPSPATPTASSNTPVCSGNTINLSTPAVAGATYSWTGPNSFVSSLQNPIITNATVAMAGTYSVTVTTSGCTSAAGTTAVVVNATPATPTASSNSPVCTGNTINLSTPAVAGATYSWTGPNSFVSSVQNPIITNATVAMAGTYSVTVTTNGCTSAVGTTAVVVNTTPATPAPSSNTPVCSGNTINLSTAAVAGATYSWTGPNSFASAVQNPVITNATVAMAGTYSLAITVNGCASAFGTTAVVVNATPATPVPSSNTPVCTGNSINLSTAAVAGATYSWTGPNTFSSSLQNPVISNATVAMAGTYSVTVTVSGCTSAAGTTAVVVNATPATPSASSNTPVCTGNTINLMTPTVAGATYSWTGPNSFASSVQNPNITNATVAMAGTYSVTVTTNGCTSGVGTTAVVINPSPATPTASSNTPVCSGNTINLMTPAVAGATYSWTGPNSFASSVQNPSITNATVAMAGTYSVTVTASGCTSAAGTTAVVVNATPATPTASSNTPVCSGNTINLMTPTVAGATYSWTGPSSFASSVQNPTRPSATVAMAGTYSVTVTTNGCTSGVGTTAVVVNPSPATPTASSNTPVCSGNTINLMTPAVAGATYSWTGPNSFASSVQNPSITNATVAMSGTYSVTVTASGCTSAAGTTAVVVNATPATPTASSNTPVCTGNTINLSTPAVAGATYSWTGPNSFVSSVQNPIITNATVAMAGTYSVTVTTNGCTSGVGTTAVVVNATPATPTASSNTPVCTGNTINLSTPAVAGATYSWTGPNSFVSSVQNPNITNATVAMAGTYSVTVTTNGCTSGAGTTAVVVNATPATPTASSNTPVCSGNTINLTTPAVAGATYSWTGPNTFSSSVQNPSITNATVAMSGTYSVTVTANGCTSGVGTTAVFVNPVIVFTASSQTNILCAGGSNGAAAVNAATGGSGGFTYNWTPGNPTGDGTTSVTGLTAATWTCTVTDANGCTAVSIFNVTEPSPLSFTAAAQTNVSCNGGSNGAASVNAATGGAGGFTYNWTPGNPTGDGTTSVTGLTAGTWTCTVTDANSCTAALSFNITAPPVLTVVALSQTNILCNGGSNGAASVSASGGAGGFSYNWTPGNPTGEGTPSVSGLIAGVWTCTTTDVNGCIATTTFNITQPTPLVLTMSSNNVSCAGGSNGSATVAVTGGTPGYSYQWLPSGGISATAIGLVAGCYTAVITDANGCTSTQTVCITQPIALSVSSTVTNVSCNAGNNGAVTVNVIGGTGAYTYSWAPAPGGGQGTATATGLIATTYTVTVTDANGCTITHSVAITEPTAVAVTDIVNHVTCNGFTDGNATVTPSGGIGPYTYVWSPTGGTNATATGLGAGPYECTITDANGCVVTHSIMITEPDPIVVTIIGTDPLCNGGTGSAMAVVTGGTPGYTYAWMPTGGNAANATGLPAGCYTVQVIDNNGCISAQTVCLTEPTAITAAQMQTNVSCNGGNNGDAMVMVSGGTPGYSYLWSPSGATTPNASNLSAGVHSCTITDANSCVLVVNFTITEPTPLLVTSTQTNVTCNNGSDGSAMVVVSGGTPTYTYIWTPTGGTAPNATGLDAGLYTCTITDDNNCVTTQTFNIIEPAAFSISGGVTNVTCNAGSDGAINIATTGGTAPYSWSWSNGDTTESISSLIAGTYNVTITDSLGCTFMTSLTVNEPAAISAPGNVTDASSCTANDGAIDLSVSGGTPGYTFLWSNFATTEDISGLDGGAYNVTITDTNGCTHVESFTITEPGAPAVTYSEPIDSACQTTTAPFTLTGETPAGGIFSGTGVSGGMFDPLAANIGYNMITYVYTDSAGCSGSAMDSVWVDLCMDIVVPVQSSGISVFPNPTNGMLTVVSQDKGLIRVFDALGNEVFTVNGTSGKTEIDLSHLTNGVYMITVQQGDQLSTQRIILNK